jgi:hypothetical protein
MEILITDLTEMHHDNYCVAGWNAARSRMVRPLPNGGHWPSALLTTHGIRPGAIIRVQASGEATGTYPHRTEDRRVNTSAISLVSPGPSRWFGSGAPPTDPSLQAVFEDNVQTTGRWDGALKGAFVPEGAEVASLGAIKVKPKNLEYFEDDFQGKKSLRAYLTDANATYNLPVVAKELRELYRSKGVAAVNRSLPSSGDLHVRVGLARAWEAQPDKCTVMINGVYW